jgi:hypothetical protein
MSVGDNGPTTKGYSPKTAYNTEQQKCVVFLKNTFVCRDKTNSHFWQGDRKNSPLNCPSMTKCPSSVLQMTEFDDKITNDFMVDYINQILSTLLENK